MKILKLSISALLLAGSTLYADREFKVLPIATDASYCASLGLALIGGFQEVHHDNGSALYGIELSLACPALQLPSNDVRQQVSLTRYDEDGITLTSLEFNPHVMFDITKDLQIGAGPGFGIVYGDASESDLVFALNAGASLNYDITSNVFLGAEARWQWTTEGEFAPNYKTSVDNVRSLLKVGMHF